MYRKKCMTLHDKFVVRLRVHTHILYIYTYTLYIQGRADSLSSKFRNPTWDIQILGHSCACSNSCGSKGWGHIQNDTNSQMPSKKQRAVSLSYTKLYHFSPRRWLRIGAWHPVVLDCTALAWPAGAKGQAALASTPLDQGLSLERGSLGRKFERQMTQAQLTICD